MPPSPVGFESTASRLSYRPAIDGLRAIAVLSVFIFHLDPAVLPGGFVGVDIFFVLSGYLITRNIHRELAAGSFSLSHFYQRRIARIAPALFVLCVSVLTVAAFLYTETDLATVGASVAATGASILNFKLIFQDTYNKLSSDTLPLLHCWSLSVEEQFYLCYPVLVWFIYRVHPGLLFPVVATLTVLSAAACIALTPLRPNYAFYLPMTRAWELGCGGLLALSGTRGGGGCVRRAWPHAGCHLGHMDTRRQVLSGGVGISAGGWRRAAPDHSGAAGGGQRPQLDHSFSVVAVTRRHWENVVLALSMALASFRVR